MWPVAPTKLYTDGCIICRNQFASIWENKDEFNALMQKASDDMLKLAKAIETAKDLQAIQKKLMWSNCSACHNRFRAEH